MGDFFDEFDKFRKSLDEKKQKERMENNNDSNFVEDEQIIEVPDTEKNKDYKELIGGIALMLIGTGVVIYGIKRNKKNK